MVNSIGGMRFIYGDHGCTISISYMHGEVISAQICLIFANFMKGKSKEVFGGWSKNLFKGTSI